jgi:SSS family solute:Na+ symporter
MLFMFVGTCLWSFYRITQLPLPAGAKADDIFPHFIATQLPVGMTGLVLAGLMAAAMSTLSSDLNCISAVAVEDYYRRLFPRATDRQRLFAGKAIVLVCGIVSVGVSLIYVRLGKDSILETIFSLYSIFSGGIAGLFALAFLTRRANRQGVLAGIIACILFTAWTFLTAPMKWNGKSVIPVDLGRWNYRHHELMVGVYSPIVLFVVGYLVSLLFPPPRPAENLTIHGWIKGNSPAPAAMAAKPATV